MQRIGRLRQVRWLTLDVGPLVLGTARHPVLVGSALRSLRWLRLVGDQNWALVVDDSRRDKPTSARTIAVEVPNRLVRGLGSACDCKVFGVAAGRTTHEVCYKRIRFGIFGVGCIVLQ